ncbi:E3 ubiquitin/ISG15 ligase TRIM25-like isoform X2 [Pomacea canaliculata]|uniref:E3 ubiquitin/ISG15 ligase TRIM25-like isoform X2 n=1 Tax=Pomacea canaliculata TaxID=400727 RepID=UPI000D730D8F|nr:E3 ubiquitin/ISG15 ligase TRIM25-like isoform X2 [Pomacea canaliculata]
MAAVVQTHERECAVCTNDFTTPKILPCGHLLCLECVIRWMDSKPDAGCPLCTCPIVEHDDNSSRTSVTVADVLPTDHVMEAIVESARVLVTDDTCSVCDDLKAEYICMQCVEKMCASCMKMHKMSISRSHDVESVSTVTPERLAASRPALCADHGDKPAEFFCTDHGLSICESCIFKKHGQCLGVKTLNEEIESAESTLIRLTKILVKSEKALKKALDKLNIPLHDIVVSEGRRMAQVDQEFDRIQQMVEASRKRVKTLIGDSSLKLKNSVSDLKKELDKRLGKVASHKHLVARASAVAPRSALIDATQALTNRVNSLDLRAKIETKISCRTNNPKQSKSKLLKIKQQQDRSERSSRESTASSRKDDKDWLEIVYKYLSDPLFAKCFYVSRMPLKPGVLYQVQIKGTDWTGRRLLCGVIHRCSSFQEEDIKCSRHRMLTKEDYVAGLMIDATHSLHFYIDGQKVETVTEDIPRLCHAVFSLSDLFNLKITPLPPVKIE